MIRHYRKARNLGLEELGTMIGMDPTQLSRIERDERRAPELPMLRLLARALGIDEASEDFKTMWNLAERSRNPGLSDAGAGLLDLSQRLRTASATAPEDPLPVFVGSLAELISRSNEYAISTLAVSITVRSADGSVQRFQVLEGRQKSVKKGKR
jgi:transcriptional regulator with XRE-family HTH domain